MTRATADLKTISRRSLVLGAAALPAAVAVACDGSADTGQPASVKVIPGKVTVISYQTSAPRLDRQIANYEAFNKEFKPQGLEVEFVNPGGQSVIEKITVLHVAGTPADMWESAFLWRDQEGALTELTPLMKADRIDEKQWLSEAISVMKAPTPWPPPSGAKVWGMPVSISADALAINLQLFEAAGLKPPPQNPDDPSWTMDAFTELATKLTKGTTQFGWGGSYTPGNEWLNGATYFGYGPIDLAGKRVTIDTAGYRAAHQYWFDMFNRRHLAPTNAELETLRSSPGQSAFLTGKVAMDRISNFPTRPDFRWGVVALPYTPNPAQPKSVAGRISVHGLYMDSDTKNKDRTWQVFKYWMRPDKNQDYVWSDGHVMSPLVKTGSEQSLKAFQDSVGPVDAKAFLLQAQRSKVDGWGLMLLKNWKKADMENIPVYADARAGKLPASEFTTKAQEAVTRLTSF
jgi:ABC-type glycerol-3-phosphate transport system substrate-binding protein